MPRCWRSRTSRPTLTTGESRPPGPSVRSGETQLHACKQDASIHHSSKLSFSGHEMLLSVIPRETVPAARPAASLPPASMARQPAGMAGVSGSVAKTHVIGDVYKLAFYILNLYLKQCDHPRHVFSVLWGRGHRAWLHCRP